MRYPSPFDTRFHRRTMKCHARMAFLSFIIPFLLFALVTLLSGCGRDSAAANTVVGTWTFSSATLQETLILKADLTYSDTETGSGAHVPATITGTYSMPDATTLIVDPGQVNSITNKVSFVDALHMTLTPDHGDAETYTRQ